MKFGPYIIGSCAVLVLTTPALSQSAPQSGLPQTQPYGQAPGAHAQPYERPERDANGNRIIINGQQVGAAQTNPARHGGSLATRSNTTLPSGGTLGPRGVTAVALGNSVNIANTYGSTIIINQTNNADQTVNVNGAPEDGGN
ncbi:MAG: hypothetical protein GYB36_11890 [Alphaproteobacteria bacterium]|nr:hypothetical protein [Alphaproteobacteria bacterium]